MRFFGAARDRNRLEDKDMRRTKGISGEDGMEGLTRSMLWVLALAGALSVLLTTGCGSPTGPENNPRTYPSGYYWLNGSGVFCGGELEVKPFEELWSGPGECAWCGGQALVCGPAVEVEPWFEGGKD